MKDLTLHNRFALIFLGLLIALLIALQGQPARAKDLKPPTDVQKFLDDFSTAAGKQDIDALMVFYSDQYLLNGEGKGQVREAWQKTMQNSPKRTCKVILTKFSQKGDLGLVEGSILTNGDRLPLRASMMIKENGAWRWYGNQKAAKEPTSDPSKLGLAFADPSWDGRKIPDGQQCSKFGGKGATPPLQISRIPKEANAIIMAYGDHDWPPMDAGGHGIIGFHISPGTQEAKIPPVPGHTYELPQGFFLVAEHLGPAWDKAGAYMPPCSGGLGNQYYVIVKAVRLSSQDDKRGKVLGIGELELGTY